MHIGMAYGFLLIYVVKRIDIVTTVHYISTLSVDKFGNITKVTCHELLDV